MNSLIGQFVDIIKREIYPVEIQSREGIIISIQKVDQAPNQYILPGFIDAHIHIESSMLVPSEFAKTAVKHGTIATVSDPHEIANVLGMQGVEYMIQNAQQVPFHFFFGAPSCVPATHFETAGAEINPSDIETLLQRDDILYLSEMMNYPGVIHQDPMVMKKIEIAHQLQKPIDGHAPGLRGETLDAYIQAGITTDHECFTYEEGLEKAQKGVQILIREGSAAKNFEALIPLMESHPQQLMFCSDDKHPDDLLHGHINQLCARAVQKGYDVFDVLQAACFNPIDHYKLPLGKLQVGDRADYIVAQDLQHFEVLQTYLAGEPIWNQGALHMKEVLPPIINQFHLKALSIEDLKIPSDAPHTVHVIGALDGELITEKRTGNPNYQEGNLVSNVEEDVLKMAVVNRYTSHPDVGLAFIQSFGLKKGAIASSVAHDSHNIVAIGVDDESLLTVINALVETQGGIAVYDGTTVDILPLPIAGLMSDKGIDEVAAGYERLTHTAHQLGSTLHAPFMSLSFMALLVIPSLKLSDKGLFDGEKFKFQDVIVTVDK